MEEVGSIQKCANKSHRRRRSSCASTDMDGPFETTFEEVSAAAYRIRSGVQKTPCSVCVYI